MPVKLDFEYNVVALFNLYIEPIVFLIDESTLSIINNIMELQIDLLSLETAESFCNGFKLAIRLITESKE